MTLSRTIVGMALAALLTAGITSCAGREGKTSADVSNFTVDETIKSASASYSFTFDGETHYASISTSLMWPEKLGDNPLSALQDSIRSVMFGAGAPAGRGIDAAIKHYVADLSDLGLDDGAAGNLTVIDSIPSTEAGEMAWYVDMTGKIIDLNEQFVTYLVTRNIYAGGAHPNSFSVGFSYDLARGVVLDNASMFAAGSEQALLNVIKETLATQLGTTVDGLADAGIFTDQLTYVGKAYLVDDAVVFHYNAYDIAPYSTGPVDVSVWAAEIEQYLTPEVRALVN